jgi:hypothetical protein
MIGYLTFLLHQLSITQDTNQTNPKKITCVASHKITNMDYACHAYANAMQLRTKHLRCYKHCIQMDRNELPFEPPQLGVPSGASKTISEAMVHLPQTVHLSCTETNTVSKRTKMSFHLSIVTQEYRPVHPKQFLSLWYVSRKPCTYQAPKLTLSPKGSKRDST